MRLFPFPFGRRRPSLRSLLGGNMEKLVSIEKSVARIEAQTSTIVDTLATVLATQKTQGDAIKAIGTGGSVDQATLDALDASIADTDVRIAALGGEPAASQASSQHAPAAA